MSLLFHKKTKTVLKWVWIVIAALIMLSMIFAYGGGSVLFSTFSN